MPLAHLNLRSGVARLDTPLQESLEDIAIPAQFLLNRRNRRIAFQDSNAECSCHLGFSLATHTSIRSLCRVALWTSFGPIMLPAEVTALSPTMRAPRDFASDRHPRWSPAEWMGGSTNESAGHRRQLGYLVARSKDPGTACDVDNVD